VPDTATLVGIVARLNFEKGHKELLKVIQQLIRNRKPVHLAAVGDGPAKSFFESFARQLGIERYVHFVGFSENIPEWLTAMDIFVLPSYREGFPRTLCEAFAMGTPAVATRIRGCRELIHDGDNGLLVEPRNEVSLYRAVESLIDSASLRRRLSDHARKHATNNLNEQIIIEKIIRVYGELGIEPAPKTKQPCVRKTGGLFPLVTDTESRGVEVS
jgi:glycosyltransferase involved in cell wall biosynthesis